MFKTHFRFLVLTTLLTFVVISCLPPSNQNLEPAIDYTAGQVDMDAAHVVLLELVIYTECHNCECAILEQPIPAYVLDSDVLKIRELNGVFLDQSADIHALLVDTKVLLGIKGLLAGQLSRTELHGYDSLPFSINEDLQDFQIYAAEKTGTVVIGTIAGDFYLAPGESWKSVSQIDPALMQSKQACYTDHVYELINQGMVEKSAVQYSEMPDSK